MFLQLRAVIRKTGLNADKIPTLAACPRHKYAETSKKLDGYVWSHLTQQYGCQRKKLVCCSSVCLEMCPIVKLLFLVVKSSVFMLFYELFFHPLFFWNTVCSSCFEIYKRQSARGTQRDSSPILLLCFRHCLTVSLGTLWHSIDSFFVLSPPPIHFLPM